MRHLLWIFVVNALSLAVSGQGRASSGKMRKIHVRLSPARFYDARKRGPAEKRYSSQIPATLRGGCLV